MLLFICNEQGGEAQWWTSPKLNIHREQRISELQSIFTRGFFLSFLFPPLGRYGKYHAPFDNLVSKFRCWSHHFRPETCTASCSLIRWEVPQLPPSEWDCKGGFFFRIFHWTPQLKESFHWCFPLTFTNFAIIFSSPFQFTLLAGTVCFSRTIPFPIRPFDTHKFGKEKVGNCCLRGSLPTLDKIVLILHWKLQAWSTSNPKLGSGREGSYKASLYPCCWRHL